METPTLDDIVIEEDKEAVRKCMLEEIRVIMLVLQTTSNLFLSEEMIQNLYKKYTKREIDLLLDELTFVGPSSKNDIKKLKAECLLTRPVDYLKDLN